MSRRRFFVNVLLWIVAFFFLFTIKRDLNEKYVENEINVKSRGAKGDGVTDDVNIINETIEYVSSLGGGKVIIPQSTGDYLISNSIIMKSNVTLEFLGNSYLRLTQPTTTGAVITNNNLSIKNVKIISPKVDGNNILGQNAIGFGGDAKNIRVLGGHILNCKRSPATGGGRAVTYQIGTEDCAAVDFIAENCTTAIDIHGNSINGKSIKNYFSNITVINCDEIFSVYDLADIGSGDTKIVNGIVDGVVARNCGTFDGGLFIFERGSNVKILNAIVVNEPTHPKIGGIVRGKGYNSVIENIKFVGDCVALINGTNAQNIQPVIGNVSAPFEKINIDGLDHIGTCDYAVKADSGGNFKMANCKFINIFLDTCRSILDIESKTKTTVYGEFIQKSTGKVQKGKLNYIFEKDMR